jgi:hypothetical protein
MPRSWSIAALGARRPDGTLILDTKTITHKSAVSLQSQRVSRLKQRGRPPGRQPRDRIDLPDGDYLEPRFKFAEETLGVCAKTAARMNLPTTYVSNVAMIKHNASLKIIAEGVRRRNEPPPKRRARR